jgi:uncharacterized membrane protein
VSWSRRFRLRQNLKGNLWLVPVLGTLTGTLAAVASAWLDRGISLPHDLQYSAATTETVLSAIVGGMVALTGFVVTVTVLVVQMATGTFSPRYLRIWYRDSALKAVLAVLLGTLAFSFSLLRRVGANSVPSLSVTFAGVLVVVGLVLFLAFLDRYLHRLRPVSVAEIVGRAGAAAIAGYASRGAVRSSASAPTDSTSTAVVRAERSGSIQAVNLPALVRWASRSGRLLVMRYGVGDFVVRDSKLFEVYGDPLSAAEERELRGLVALGVERTIDQDPAFALRIMVDIANRALSPAVNDPTTATQVMDYLSDWRERPTTSTRTAASDSAFQLRRGTTFLP